MAIGTVRTTLGKVSGVELDGDCAGITQFRDIPYAQPPLGELRWKAPVPAEPWDGVRVCDKWPAASIQTFFPGDDLYPLGRPERGEDCLYLNITTPAQSGNDKLPVYLWYHDGGLSNGFSYDVRNDPRGFAKKGIVVVSVGHRLAEFGYLSLPQLTAEQGQSGNYGVMDTVLALRWVHDNIAAFGGDPDNITLGGESGGCAKICALAALPETKGLFRRVINESGLNWLRQIHTQAEAEEEGSKYLRSMGIDENISLHELRAMDAYKIHDDTIDPHFLPGQMTIDGLLFDKEFRYCFLDNVDGLDFLNCVCAGEGDPCYDKALLGGEKHITTAKQFYAHFRNILGDLYDKYDFENLVHTTDETAWKDSLLLTTLGLSRLRGHSNGARNIMAARIFGKTVAERYGRGKIYTVRFNHLQPPALDGREESPAAPHGSDNVYASKALVLGVAKERVYDEEDRAVSEMFNEYLANFIRTGNPNGEGLVHWYDSDTDFGWLDFTAQPVAHRGMEGKLDELLLEFVKKEYDI